jgi:hypothetical protein
LQTTGFEVCSEITAKIRRMGYGVWEVPIYYEPRTVAEGKKIRAVDALRAMWTLVRFRSLSPHPSRWPSSIATGD